MFVCRTHDSCISKAVLKAEKICADRGVRFTGCAAECSNWFGATMYR